MSLKQFQSDLKFDAVILIYPDPNIVYFTQIKTSFSILIITKDNATLYLTKLDKVPKLKNIKVKFLPKKWESLLKFKHVGINAKFLTVEFQNKFPKNTKITDISKKLANLRSIKTEEEIDKIKKACKITDKVFQTTVDNLENFKTEQQVSFFIEKEIRENNAELAFKPIVANHLNSAIPHHIPCKHKLRNGFLLLDFGAKYQNYCSDMTRVLFLGTPSSKDKEFYNKVLQAQESTINQIKENKPFLELDTYVKEELKPLQKHFTHSLGHGLGIEVHEDPFFKKGQIIKNSNVFTIEPGLYYKERGVRIEDTLIYKGKPQILTKSPKDLISLPKTF